MEYVSEKAVIVQILGHHFTTASHWSSPITKYPLLSYFQPQYKIKAGESFILHGEEGKGERGRGEGSFRGQRLRRKR